MTEDRAASALREKVALTLSGHHRPLVPWCEVDEWRRNVYRQEAKSVLAALDLPALLAEARERGRVDGLREAHRQILGLLGAPAPAGLAEPAPGEGASRG